jgi:hypothetical protein
LLYAWAKENRKKDRAKAHPKKRELRKVVIVEEYVL